MADATGAMAADEPSEGESEDEEIEYEDDSSALIADVFKGPRGGPYKLRAFKIDRSKRNAYGGKVLKYLQSFVLKYCTKYGVAGLLLVRQQPYYGVPAQWRCFAVLVERSVPKTSSDPLICRKLATCICSDITTRNLCRREQKDNKNALSQYEPGLKWIQHH